MRRGAAARGDAAIRRRAGWHCIAIPLYLLFEHDLFGKPVSTFPDHALAPLVTVDLVRPHANEVDGFGTNLQQGSAVMIG
jgi:hypothetical protein